MKPFLIISACWLLVVMGVSGGISHVSAKERSLQDKIRQERNNLDQLKQDIQATKKKREETQQRHDAVLQAIETHDRELHRQRKEFDAINRELKQADRELEKIGNQLETLRSSLNTQKHAVETRLKHLYMERQGGWFRPLVASKSYTQFQRRLTYLSTLANWEHRLLERYRTDLKQFERLKGEQARSRKALLRNKRRTEKSLNEMKAIKAKKHVVLASLKRKTLSQDRRLETLERAESRKEALLKEFQQRSKIAKGMIQKRPAAILRKGALLWPADGKVVTLFGRQKHPTFDTFIDKKGIEIKTTEGSSIRAASGGKVVYADWLKGYGLVVILDHQNGFFSLYAHASKLLVSEDDEVSAGEVMGETGESGLTDKNILYFELRKGTKPLDPLTWLVKRR